VHGPVHGSALPKEETRGKGGGKRAGEGRHSVTGNASAIRRSAALVGRAGGQMVEASGHRGWSAGPDPPARQLPQ